MLLSAVDRRSDLSKSHDLPTTLGDDEIHEILRTFQTPLQANGALVEIPVHASNRSRQVLLLQRLRVELNGHLPFHSANELHLRNAGN